MQHLIAQMNIEVAGVGDQVNQTEFDQRHHGEEENNGLEKFLTGSPWIFDRAKLLFDRSGVKERVFDNQLTEVERRTERKVSDRRRMVDGSRAYSRFVRMRQKLRLSGKIVCEAFKAIAGSFG